MALALIAVAHAVKQPTILRVEERTHGTFVTEPAQHHKAVHALLNVEADAIGDRGRHPAVLVDLCLDQPRGRRAMLTAISLRGSLLAAVMESVTRTDCASRAFCPRATRQVFDDRPSPALARRA